VKCNNSLDYFFFYHGATTIVGQVRITEASRSHSDTPHSIELLCTSDQPEARSKAEVCGSSLAGIAGLNPSGGMSVCLSVVNVVSCQVEISAMDRSLNQRSPTECCVSVCDLETSIMRRPMKE
jgi:hypothetical protein